MWIPYDAVDTFLPKGSEQRRWYEAEVGWKVENVLAQEDGGCRWRLATGTAGGGGRGGVDRGAALVCRASES